MSVGQRITLPDFPVEGGCTCGALRYRLSGRPLYVIACHCRACQRLGGSDYTLSMFVLRRDFTAYSGIPARSERTAESGRRLPGLFCSDCGTRVWHEPVHSPHTINIRAGTLDDPSWAQPIGHIWIECKKAHVTLPPDAIRIEGQPTDRQPFLDAWAAATGG